ncbi:pyridoxal 5'-phosphate synthase glutaminase subunit PdxT [Picrophilus oshimae]|uniref:Pyridoxal 5'-phosphate synthase subunit PdxT n=1 Tax=Picrophilus torridus (strain ATCC 700027 / DSM 9790 / JCM 10055 / NBRC 100828 / KAW 2/3) TaxID=1122961 RepID=PDXT_PICTO|nr:pyridoxal 5'-phosphate synthase glutaminase subunit PdxT [Picrophilus oshimae]Q6L1R3.1 RecName: Full=Pyridoxal 5'-phosphate synthase subunit PdxT; AltName: Full=Pdx2; AltName: Full=Pyridoxal 5'-phosphate synthase glutaminase subunit [Picrophilus oshimae DSM 9789]AAT43089.1 pyridoxine biosynthesis amidotransferase [Picrophilus oshimae DSM 9789]
MKIGVLGIQGDVYEHYTAIRPLKNKYKVEAYIIRSPEEINEMDGIIIPGGESTTITRFLSRYINIINENVRNGMKIMGTCAGAIILSKDTGDPRVHGTGIMDIKIQRNAYGRQIDSFIDAVNIKNIGTFNAVFIRAPVIDDPGKTSVLGEYNGKPVIVENENAIAMTFHPELTGDLRVHEYFLRKVMGN